MMGEREKWEKVITGLEFCDCYGVEHGPLCGRCPYHDECECDADRLMHDALELLKAQNEIIYDLLKVGYPHNFQREEPWIVNYMYAITDVIRKAVNFRNE